MEGVKFVVLCRIYYLSGANKFNDSKNIFDFRIMQCRGNKTFNSGDKIGL